MNKLKKCAVAFAGLIACFAATPGTAGVVIATYYGTLRGVDELGIFGSANSNLNGAAFTATYRIDDSIGQYFQNSLQYLAYAGGTVYGPGHPSPLTASLQINGINYAFPTANAQSYGQILIENGSSGEDGITHEIRGPMNSSGYYVNGIYTRLTSLANDFITSTNLLAPVDRVVAAGDSPYGYAYIGAYGSPRDIFDLFITRVTVVPQVSTVLPEPATWAMMLAGVGVVGGAMRRRGGARPNAAPGAL